MHYFVTIVYNVTSESANNLLSTAIASDSVFFGLKISFKMSEGRLNVSLFL